MTSKTNECGESYKFGEYVAYDCDYDPRRTEIGRVVHDNHDGTYSVCYHTGCTPQKTPTRYLRRATESEIRQAPEHLGYKRFDKACEEYDPEVCFGCHGRRHGEKY